MKKQNLNRNGYKSYKNKKKSKSFKVSTIIVFILSLACIITACILIFFWIYNNNKSEKIAEEITKITPIEEVKDNNNTELINPPEVNSQNDYWDFVKLPLINVDFSELLKRNSDTVGWINVNNTNINYPVVQTNNNDDYLHKAFDGSKNQAGWIFADYRNDIDRKSVV